MKTKDIIIATGILATVSIIGVVAYKKLRGRKEVEATGQKPLILHLRQPSSRSDQNLAGSSTVSLRN